MAFREDFTEFLDIEQGFAIRASLIPKKGAAYEIVGIFNNDYYAIEAGLVGIEGSSPNFSCSNMEAKSVAYGDLLKTEDVTYRITEIRPDGTGWVVLGLEKTEIII